MPEEKPQYGDAPADPGYAAELKPSTEDPNKVEPKVPEVKEEPAKPESSVPKESAAPAKAAVKVSNKPKHGGKK